MSPMSHALRVALVALPLAVCACTVGEEQPETDESDLISFNGLSPAALVQSGDSLQALAGVPLDGATTDLANSADGQAVLTDLVRCALPTGASASFPSADGTDLVLPGLIGLAPGWQGAPIDETDQRFVTACLMAHVNGLETPFPISVRSKRRVAPLTERITFPHEELAAYGNIFKPAAERELFACFGEAVAQSLGSSGGLDETLGLPSYLDVRFCGVSEQGCGFSLAGACFRFGGDVTTSACETRSGTIYDRCHERPIEEAPTPAFEEAVTVYLQTGDLALILGDYTGLVCEALGVCLDLDLGGIL